MDDSIIQMTQPDDTAIERAEEAGLATNPSEPHIRIAGLAMPTFSAESSTPTYVLMNDGRRIGPRLTPVLSEKSDVIYGFSSKAAYESFRENSEQALTPYPLVKRYLSNRIEETGKEHKLVAIDAKGPLDATLRAATIAEVLHAQKEQMALVTSAYLLSFDEDENSYRLAEVSATP